MKNMTLSSVAIACNGTAHGISESLSKTELEGVVIDSRQVEKNYLFIATRGARVDGHDFIGQVMQRGAIGVLCEEPPKEGGVPYILVKDSFQALKDIAEYYRSQLSIPVIGITGSVGKTSTKEFIATVLEEKYKVLRTVGNLNNEIGLPLTILRIREEHEAAVLEMGISEFGEMHRLSKVARPDVCVITNIGLCHLENLGSREGILKAKTEIFDFIRPDGMVCCNGDDDMLQTLGEVNGKAPIFFGMGENNKINATAIENLGLFGSNCTIHTEDGSFDAYVPLPGEHMVFNALAATGVARLLGLTLEEIKKGIAKVAPVGGRSNVIKTDHYVIIDDCYNANPTSVKAAILLLNSATTRKVAILGDMFELGKDELSMHEEVGRSAREAHIDVICCVGKLSRAMYEGAIKAKQNDEKRSGENQNDENLMDKNQNVLYFENKDVLKLQLESILQQGDTILVKASHSMGFEEIVSYLNLKG